MISRVLAVGLASVLVAGCVNDGELFEGDAGVGGDGLFDNDPASDPADIPVVVTDGTTTGVLDPADVTPPAGEDVTGGGTGGDSDGTAGDTAGVDGTTGAGSGDGAGDGSTEPESASQNDAQIDANNGMFLLPADCVIVTGNDGRKYCFSRLNGENLYATTANDRLLWSYTLPADSGFTVDRMLVDETLMVFTRAIDDSRQWNLIAFSRNGEQLYSAAVLTGSVEINDARLTDNGIVTVTNRGEENGFQVSRIDRESGAVVADLRFPDAVVESLEFEDTDEGQRIVLVVDGRRQYFDALTFEQIIIVYALDPSNYQANFPQMMTSLRADYVGDFLAAMRATNSFIDAGAAPLETDGSIYSCAVSGTVERLPEDNMVNAMTFTRAYQFDDCVLSTVTINGRAVYSVLGIQGPSGANGTEIVTFDSMQLSTEDSESTEADGGLTLPAAAAQNLSGSMSNIWVEGGDVSSSEMTVTVTSYTSSLTETATRIVNATYSRTLSSRSNSDGQSTELVLFETGAAEVNAGFTGGVATTLTIDPAFDYTSEAGLSEESLAAAPRSGSLLAEAADGSVLRVDAAGDSLVYSIATETGDSTFEDGWLVAPLGGEIRF